MLIYKVNIEDLNRAVEAVLITTVNVKTVTGLACFNRIDPKVVRNAILGGLLSATGDYYYADDWVPVDLRDLENK